MNKYFKDLEYKLIERKVAYQGKRLKVEELRYLNGDTVVYREHVIPGNAAVILPITEDGNVIMIQEPRTAINKVILGLPAGQMDENEEFADCAIRELEEETGYRAQHVKKMLDVYPSVGYTSEKIGIYLATDLVKTQRHLDPTEDINVIKLPLAEVKRMLDNNEIITATSVVALSHYFMYEKDQEK